MESALNKIQIPEGIGIPHFLKSSFVFNLDPRRLINGFCREERIVGRNKKKMDMDNTSIWDWEKNDNVLIMDIIP